MLAPFLRRSHSYWLRVKDRASTAAWAACRRPSPQPGSIGGMNGGGLSSGMNGGTLAGPTVGPNGREELANPGATLAPNEAQYPIGQGPSGMKCPTVLQFSQQYACTLAFNIPPPSPSPSPNGKSTAKPTASPTPTPKPTASSDDDNRDEQRRHADAVAHAARHDDAADGAAAARRAKHDEPKPASSCTSRRSWRSGCRATWTSI